MIFGEDLLKMDVDTYVGTTNNDHAIYAREMLKNEDFEVVVADDQTLMLDYDDVEGLPSQFYITLGILENVMGKPVYFQHNKSKSGTGIHVLIYLPGSMPIVLRVAWQAAFGSDPKREALHLLSIARGDLNPILLYQPKGLPHSGVDEDGNSVIQASSVELATPEKLLAAGVPQLLLGDGNAGQSDQS